MQSSNKKLQKYAGLLNDAAPENHILAYITPQERDMLVDAGGVKTSTPSGIFAYPPLGQAGTSPGTTTSGGSAFGGGGNDNNDGGNAREQYAAKQTQTGFVKGGGAVTYTGGDKDDPSSYTVSDAIVSPEVVQQQKEQYEEQFGGISPLGSRPVDYSTKYEYNQIKNLQQNKLDRVIGKLKQAGYDIDWDSSLTDVKDFIGNISTEEMAESYKDLGIYSPETIDRFEKYGYVPQSNIEMKSQFPLGAVAGANLLADIIPSKSLTKDELLSDLNTINEIGQSQGEMSWIDRLEKYSPKQYESLTGTTYNPVTKTYTKRDSGGAEVPVDSSEFSSLIQPIIPDQPSMVNRYFASMGGGQSSLSSSLQTDYNNAKNSLNSILGVIPPSQQFGYSADPYGGLMASNLTTNPFNIDYLRRLGLI